MKCSNDKIVILGAGGFAREVYHLIKKSELHEVVGFICPDSSANADNLPLSLLGNDESLPRLIKDLGISSFVPALGDPETRKKCYEYACSLRLKPLNVIHPTALTLTDIGTTGCVIYPNATIMNDCNLGKGVVVNCNVSLGHDIKVGDFCNLNPGVRIAGRVVIGTGTTIGIGAVVKEKIRIGKNVTVGAGSVVVKDIPDRQTVYGNPARKQQ